MKKLATLFSALLALAAPAAASEPKVGLSEWKLARFRYGQGDKIPKKVEAHIKLTNTSKVALRGIKSRLIYYASTGETVKATGWQFVSHLAPGKSRTVRYVEGLVPAFEAYELELHCQADGKPEKWRWRSADPVSLPSLWSEKPIKGVSRLVLVGREISPDRRTRLPRVYLRVKNLGDKPAKRAAVIVEFLGEKGKILASYKHKLGDGTVPGGKELTFNFVVPKKVPAYGGYRVKLTAAKPSAEQSLSGGTFSDKPELELAEFKFTRKKDNALHITAKIRNGQKKPVTDPAVVIVLMDKSTPPAAVKKIPFTVTGRLAPGEIKPFALTVPGCPAFGNFSYELEFSERTEPVFKPVTAQVAPGRVGVARVEVRNGPEGELLLVTTVLSRAPYEVTKVKVTFTLTGGPKGEEVGKCAGGLDRLAAGKTAKVTAELLKPPKFATFTYKITYTEPKPPAKKED